MMHIKHLAQFLEKKKYVVFSNSQSGFIDNKLRILYLVIKHGIRRSDKYSLIFDSKE